MNPALTDAVETDLAGGMLRKIFNQNEGLRRLTVAV
jgi:hypothetical protein